jgi:hypothetical protein
MCLFKPPKVSVPAAAPPAQYQTMQVPKEMGQDRTSDSYKRRRRGMWASIFTSPQGITGAPSVTGTSGGVTGG